MLWSSFYPNEVHKIPGIDDRVLYGDRPGPYRVVRRIVKGGSVLLDLSNDSDVLHNVLLETVNWFPEVGDMCELKLKPYLEWRKIYNDFALPEWFWKASKLVEVQNDKAIILPGGNIMEQQMVPFECLVVVNKKR